MAKSKKKQRRTKKNIVIFTIMVIIFIVLAIINFNTKKGGSETATQNSNNATTTATSTEHVDENSTATEEIKPSIVETLSAEEIEQSKKRGLPVLMYHFFYDANAGETARDNNFMEIHDFEEQIKYLSENNYYVPTWEEVEGYISGSNGLPLKSVVITVDDGDESFFRLAVPVLEKYNFTATSFLITSWYGNAVAENNSKSIDFQSHSDDMHKSGSNGKGAFLTISYEDACADLEACRSIIGNNCKIFCYPFGHFDDRCKQILKDCNYTLAFTTQGGRVYPGADPYELPRVRMSKGVSLNSFIDKVK